MKNCYKDKNKMKKPMKKRERTLIRKKKMDGDLHQQRVSVEEMV